jgi:cytochrome c-type biogenesis protein
MEILTIYFAGFLSFFAPCVLPLIPIYLSSMLGQNISAELSDGDKKELLIRGILFSAGFIIVFAMLGLGAGSLGIFFKHNRMIIQLISAIIILLFALKFLNVIQIPLLDKVVYIDNSRFKTRFSSINALLMGVLFAAGWSPCIGPVLGSILTYTASKAANGLRGAMLLAVFGIGFATPMIITSAFAGKAIGFFKKNREFIRAFEKIIGIILIFISMSMILEVSDYNMGGRLASDVTKPGKLPVMLEVYDKDCSICQSMKPIIEQLKKDCHMKFAEIRAVDISEPQYKYLATELEIVGVPTFIFINKEGKEISRLIGYQTIDSLKQSIAMIIDRPCPGTAASAADKDKNSPLCISRRLEEMGNCGRQ